MSISRRRLLATAGAGLGAGALGLPLARPALATTRPERLVYVGDTASWKGTMIEDAAPEFERETGIHVEFIQLPSDALVARFRSELTAQSDGIDIAQFGASWVSWIHPHIETATDLMASADNPYADDFDWDDFTDTARQIGRYEDRQLGIPYRLTQGILHYQPEVLSEAGFDAPPTTWDEMLRTALAVTEAGEGRRYGLGFALREGPAITDQWVTFLRSNGGTMFDLDTQEIFIEEPEAIESLDFLGDLVTRHQVVAPEAVTWEFDGIISNGQSDRYGMTITFGATGSLLNDPAVSATGGRWAWAVAPGATSPEQSRTFLSGWNLGVPRYSRHKEWAFAFIQYVAGKHWSARSIEKGNAPARLSVLQDPEIVARYGWPAAAAAAIPTAVPTPQHPLYPACESAVRRGVSRVVLGQTDAATALSDVAENFRRIFERGAAL